jgi:hypothetical protein
MKSTIQSIFMLIILIISSNASSLKSNVTNNVFLKPKAIILNSQKDYVEK